MFGKKERKKPSLKIFFASDFHGSNIIFRKFLNAAKIYEADALIFGGDITGKAIIPIVKRGDGTYETNYFGQQKALTTQEELSAFMKVQSDTGYYPLVMEKGEYEEIANNESKKTELFHQLMSDRINEWISLAVERLKSNGTKLYMEAGNDDFEGIEKFFDSDVSIDIGEKITELDGYEILGLSKANMTPWHAPRDVEEDELWKIIEKQLSKVDGNDKLIMAYHPPPINTNLDLAPKIEKNLSYANAGGQQIMVHVGSSSVRKAIEERNPILSLHGHIHESRGIDRIGNTVCINPGSEYTEGILHGGLVLLNGSQVLNQILITG